MVAEAGAGRHHRRRALGHGGKRNAGSALRAHQRQRSEGGPAPGTAAPGLYALDIETGARRWAFTRKSRCPDEECVYGVSAAIIAANDIVVAGSIDGMLEVLNASTGKLLWSHDSWRSYASANGIETKGGAFDAHGPMLADDLLVVTSGYGYVGRQRAGNALLVFQVKHE